MISDFLNFSFYSKFPIKMKVASFIALAFFFVSLLLGDGCDSVRVASKPPSVSDTGLDVSIYTRYAPAKLDILPLTEFITVGDTRRTSQINLYASLLDPFGSQIKSPGVFRFELYEYVQYSIDHKGGRVLIWPDIDLTDPAKNNEHWRDFLRAYEFNLDFEIDTTRTYVLHVTCLCPDFGELGRAAGKHFSSDVILKPR
jgi:hypothetical protein